MLIHMDSATLFRFFLDDLPGSSGESGNEQCWRVDREVHGTWHSWHDLLALSSPGNLRFTPSPSTWGVLKSWMVMVYISTP
jgi:hypothetical protein